MGKDRTHKKENCIFTIKVMPRVHWAETGAEIFYIISMPASPGNRIREPVQARAATSRGRTCLTAVMSSLCLVSARYRAHEAKMLKRSDSAGRGMHEAGAAGACEMQTCLGRARMVALAETCGLLAGKYEPWLASRVEIGSGRARLGRAGRERGSGWAGPCEGPGRMEGRAVWRVGPYEGPGRVEGPCGPIGEREREGRAVPVRTYSSPLWPVSGRTQRRGMHATRVSEARHHGLPGSPRCPQRVPLGRGAAAGDRGGTRGGGARRPAKSRSGRRRGGVRPGWIGV